MTEQPGEDQPEVASDVSKSVIEAYYPRLVALGDTARARAQNAYAIASAVAGVLVVAVITSKAELASLAVRWLGLVALALWLLAAGSYIRAVATPVSWPQTGDLPTPDDLVRAVVAAAKGERQQVDQRQRTANVLALLAMLTTVAAFASLFFWPASTQSQGTLRLTTAGMAAVRAVCPGATRSLPGQVILASIGTDFIAVDVSARACGGRPVQIQVPKDQVATIVLAR